MVKAYENNVDGYGLRVTKNVPKNSAQLAYIKSEPISTTDNIVLVDETEKIPENQRKEGASFETYSNEEGYLATKDGSIFFQESNFLLSDEYTRDGKFALPYVYVSRGKTTLKGAMVSLYKSGNVHDKVIRFETLTEQEREDLVYEDKRMYVSFERNKPLDGKVGIKFRLKREEDGYRIFVYCSEEEGLRLHYENTSGVRVEEVVNTEPLFQQKTEEEIENLLSNGQYEKVFAVKKEEKGHLVRVPFSENHILVHIENRAPHYFQYQVKSELQARISDKNPMTLRVGLLYFNENRYGEYNLSPVGKRLWQNNKKHPKYLTFENARSRSGFHDPNFYEYWLADPDMPLHHYFDYDILIVTGYGKKDLNRYHEPFTQFLEAGKTLIVDNTGTGEDAFDFTVNNRTSFLYDVGFSKTTNASGKVMIDNTQTFLKERFYLLTKSWESDPAPIFTYNNGETQSNWETWMTYEGGQAALIRRKGIVGNLFLSNFSWMKQILFQKERFEELSTNLFLLLGEKRTFFSPKFHDHVYHRDNLFLEEYRNEKGETLYLEDVNDYDDSQIVAKKIIGEKMSNWMRPYLPSSFWNATGTYEVEASGRNDLYIENHDFEIENESDEDTWDETTVFAIPGWNTVVFAGQSATFSHHERKRTGQRAVGLSLSNTQGFWEQDFGVLAAGQYTLSVWISSENASNLNVGFFHMHGDLLVKKDLEKTTPWKEIKVSLTLKESTPVFLRIGATTTNGSGKIDIDAVSFFQEGSVYMTKPNTGNESLYAYATSSKGEGFDFSLFGNGLSVQKEQLPIDGLITVKSFVYRWNIEQSRYVKVYGNSIDHPFSVKEIDNWKNIGNLYVLLPSLKEGAEWADKKRVYFEVEVRDEVKRRYVEVQIYDQKKDSYLCLENGEWVFGYEDLFYAGEVGEVILRVRTQLYGLRGKEKAYFLKEKTLEHLSVSLRNQNEKDVWMPFIRNRSFQREGLDREDVATLSLAGRQNYFDDRVFGSHTYGIPEYERQGFYPNIGEKRITREQARYLDEKEISVENTPLRLLSGRVEKETLKAMNTEGTLFQGSFSGWKETPFPILYGNTGGQDFVLDTGFTIDYENGQVSFTQKPTGIIKASYSYQNYTVYRQGKEKKEVWKEELRSVDENTFSSKHPYWNTEGIRIYRYGKEEKYLVPPEHYSVDEEDGSIVFHAPVLGLVYADYSYYEREDLTVVDYDKRKGTLFLKEETSFRDDIYVSYIYEENHYGYRGYFNEEDGVFVRLDLNPSAGHTSVLKTEENGKRKWIETPTEKLLGKEIYLYLLPMKSVYGNIVREEKNPLRHVHNEEEWLSIKRARPEALLLAKLLIREHTSKDKTIVMDARVYGGGLKESWNEEKIEAKIGSTDQFWDVGTFNGLPYHGAGTTVISLPKTVLKNHGGIWTEEEIREKIKLYLAEGIYPILTYQDDKTSSH